MLPPVYSEKAEC